MPRISYFGISLDIRIFNITDGGTTFMRKTLGASGGQTFRKTKIMDKSRTILKVKDTSFMMTLVVAFCIFPIIFFLLANALHDNYILALAITALIYLGYGIFFIRRLKRDEETWALTATDNSITLGKHGTFHWDEISAIETFCEIPIGHRSPNKYIKFVFSNADDIILDASNYDIDYKDLKSKLLTIKTKQTKNNIA